MLAVGHQPHAGGGVVAADHRGGRAVAEQPQADEVGERGLPRLVGQRAELDRDHQRVALASFERPPWMGEQVVLRLRKRGAARGAAELLDRKAPDRRAQPQLPGDGGVGARQHVAGAGDHHQGVYVDRVDPGSQQRAPAGAGAELHDLFGVEPVAGAEALLRERVV
jgi:hypothetical protein